jgi:hypothetical protein
MVALGKVLASKSCQLEELSFAGQCLDDTDGLLTGHIGILAQGLRWNESLRRLDLSWNGLLDKDIEDLGQILPTCKLQKLDLSGNKITHSGFVSFTHHIPKSLKSFDFSSKYLERRGAAECHTLTLFEEHPQLWDDGVRWKYAKTSTAQKIQHLKDLNRCGRILLACDGAIPLSVWPIVLARANALLVLDSTELGLDSNERAPNAIFHLLQGPALMQRRFDRDSSQATCVGAGVSERLPTSSKRGPAETIDQASAKKGRAEY